MALGEAVIFVVAWTVKAGEDWVPQWGVGTGGVCRVCTFSRALGDGGGGISISHRWCER